MYCFSPCCVHYRTWDREEEESSLQELHTGQWNYREIDPDDLQLGDFLGKGAFGKVYKGNHHKALYTAQQVTKHIDNILFL